MLQALASNRPEIRYAWCGSSILIIDTLGRAGEHPLTGYFFRQARFLKDLRLLVNGEQPYLCSVCDVDPQHLELTYIFPEVEAGGGGGSGSGGDPRSDGLLFRTVTLRVLYHVRPASLDVTLHVHNAWQEDLRLSFEWQVSADYAAMDDAQFDTRRYQVDVDTASTSGLTFRSRHRQLPFETHVTAGGAQWAYTADRISTLVTLPRQQTLELSLRIRAIDRDDEVTEASESAREQKLADWLAGTARFHAPGETPLIEIANRGLHDLGSLALLDGPEEEWLAPGAGVPIYQMFWGRDALTAVWQMGLFDGGAMARDVLQLLDRLQGTREDLARDEQPGRIINQAKRDPLSRIGGSPFDRYYADVASPFMFIIAYGYAYVVTGSKDLLERHWPAALRVMEWAQNHGDRDGDGYIEYLTKAPNGPRHQGWKDSENAVVDERGARVDPPIAACEIQGYYHAALQYMAGLALVLGERDRAAEFWRAANELKERFNRDFWMEDEGFVAFGLDAHKKPIRVVTSNGAQCLPTGIVSKENIPRLVRRMFHPDLFSGWGLRTLSSSNPAYNPLDYHLGSVWPVENASIVFGLRRYGLNDRALQLIRALYDLARLWPGGRIPECVGGFARNESHHPGNYPRANRPQAWNQSVFPLLVQAIVGAVPFAPAHTLMVDPILPPWLPEVTIKDMRIGDAITTLRFWRKDDGDSAYEVVHTEGDLRVIRQPWLESFPTNLWDRFHDLAETLVHW